MKTPSLVELKLAIQEAKRLPVMTSANVRVVDGVAVFTDQSGNLLGCMNAEDFERLKSELKESKP